MSRKSKAGAECCNCRQGAPDTGREPGAMPESPERKCNQAAAGNNQRNHSIRSEIAHRTGEIRQQGHGPKQHRSLSSAHPTVAQVTKYRVSAEWHVNSPRPSQGRDTELAIAPEPRSQCGKKAAEVVAVARPKPRGIGEESRTVVRPDRRTRRCAARATTRPTRSQNSRDSQTWETSGKQLAP